VPVNRQSITVELVQGLIADQFPRWAHLAVRPVELNGWDNVTFRLGEELSVRVWVHGDVVGSNLLLTDGRPSGVIDCGCAAVGDPACDLPIAWWSFSGQSRAVFRGMVPVDEATWARGRGWALWKALVTLRRARAPGATAATSRVEWAGVEVPARSSTTSLPTGPSDLTHEDLLSSPAPSEAVAHPRAVVRIVREASASARALTEPREGSPVRGRSGRL
jgi:Phosphotransferase enzyme family